MRQRYIIIQLIILFSANLVFAEESKFQIGKSLAAAKLHLSALKMFRDILDGSAQPNSTQALDAMITSASTVHAELLIYKKLEDLYKNQKELFLKLGATQQQHAHFILAKHAFLTQHLDDVVAHAQSVKIGHADYAKAQYLLGVTVLNKKDKIEDSTSYFEKTLRVTDPKTSDSEILLVRDLANLGLARVYYEKAFVLNDEDPKRAEGMRRALSYYRAIPRFSQVWADSLIEQGWAHTVLGEYGDALGKLYSMDHDYFRNTFYPEKDILRASVYWYNCQWDRVNRTLDGLKQELTNAKEVITARLKQNSSGVSWVEILKSDKTLPSRVVQSIMRDMQYQEFEVLIANIDKETERLPFYSKSNDIAAMRSLTQNLTQTKKQLIEVFGEWIKNTLAKIATDIDDVLVRSTVVSLETKTAEAEWLEQGRQIEGKKRHILARPYVAHDKNQFWWVTKKESFIDELGYYRYNIKSECYD